MRISHLISNLNLGGAETSLCSLVEATRGMGQTHTVISMLSHGALRARLQRAGAEVIELGGARGARGALLLNDIRAALLKSHPDVIQCWMYHANVAASALALIARLRRPIIWGIRQGCEDIAIERATTRVIIRSGALLSRQPAKIVYNSERSAEDHERLGYAPEASAVIWNGVDCDRFQPLSGARERLISQLGSSGDAILIGRVARYAPMKDYPNLLVAFASVARQLPDAHLILIGPSLDGESGEILRIAERLGCRQRVHVLKMRLNIEEIYPAFDVLVSSSKLNEGFPNTVAEALACGTRVVSTSVGESKLVREGCHRVVSPGNAEELAAAIFEMTHIAPAVARELGMRGRAFILNNFNARLYASSFAKIWLDTCAGTSTQSSQ